MVFILFHFQVIKKAVSKNLYNWCNIVWNSSSIWPVYNVEMYVVGVIIKHNSFKLFYFRDIMVVLCIRGLIFLWFFLCTSISMFHIFELIFLTLKLLLFSLPPMFSSIFHMNFYDFYFFCWFETHDFIFMIMVYRISIIIKCLYWTSSSSCSVLNFLIVSLEYFVYKCVII